MDRLSKIIEITEEKSKGKKGISIYIPKENTFVFIETVPAQRFNMDCAKYPKKESDLILDLP